MLRILGRAFYMIGMAGRGFSKGSDIRAYSTRYDQLLSIQGGVEALPADRGLVEKIWVLRSSKLTTSL